MSFTFGKGTRNKNAHNLNTSTSLPALAPLLDQQHKQLKVPLPETPEDNSHETTAALTATDRKPRVSVSSLTRITPSKDPETSLLDDDLQTSQIKSVDTSGLYPLRTMATPRRSSKIKTLHRKKSSSTATPGSEGSKRGSGTILA